MPWRILHPEDSRDPENELDWIAEFRPMNERLSSDLQRRASTIVPDFIVQLSTVPDGPTSPYDWEHTYRDLERDGELLIEAALEGFRLTPLTVNALWHVRQLPG